MPIQTIDIGTSANDGTGDPIRTAGDKINDNFLSLDHVTGCKFSGEQTLLTFALVEG
jgi:hypothetical protein